MARRMPSRLTAVLAALLICAVVPAPALAHHHPGYWDQSGDPSATDGEWTPTDDPAAPTETPGFPTIAPPPTVAGKVAMLRTDGKAAIPRGAPKVVRALIAAANRI